MAISPPHCGDAQEVEIFLLRNLGYSSEQLAKAAYYAHLQDHDNPFFDILTPVIRRRAC